MDKNKVKELPVLSAVWIEDGADPVYGEKVASRLNIPAVRNPEHDQENSLVLSLTAQGLALQYGERRLLGDFTDMERRLKPSNLQREMLVKACRIKGKDAPVLIDATAGMGEDSMILAASGFIVNLFERDPVIAALLGDAMRRAGEIPELSDPISRMTLREEDSTTGMKQLEFQPDVILLDPMFPEKQKNSLTKKKFQLLHFLERPCTEENELFEAAVQASPKKIVVKRPLKGPWLADRKPDYSLKGKSIRYDCYVFVRNE